MRSFIARHLVRPLRVCFCLEAIELKFPLEGNKIDPGTLALKYDVSFLGEDIGRISHRVLKGLLKHSILYAMLKHRPKVRLYSIL